jgi:branched-chain amino acid transport system permease protein
VTQALNLVLGGVFHAAALFLVAAGLQLVFGVQRILNLACGSFYALGAYAGIAAVKAALGAGVPAPLFVIVLVGAGLVLAVLGPLIERLLRTIYDRDEAFQLLLTFALVLILEDVIRFVWGAAPYQLGDVYLVYGQVRLGAVAIPVYNFVVIATGLAIAAGMGFLLSRTRFGRIVRATAENRAMAQALGVDMSRVFSRVFTLGMALGTVGGALVIPAGAAVSEMGIELIVEAFAVVVIGGLGSMRGAFVGALIVGVLKAVAIAVYPEAEMLAIYVIVIAVLVLRPAGLFARAAA